MPRFFSLLKEQQNPSPSGRYLTTVYLEFSVEPDEGCPTTWKPHKKQKDDQPEVINPAFLQRKQFSSPLSPWSSSHLCLQQSANFGHLKHVPFRMSHLSSCSHTAAALLTMRAICPGWWEGVNLSFASATRNSWPPVWKLCGLTCLGLKSQLCHSYLDCSNSL